MKRWTKSLIPVVGATALLATLALPAVAQSEDTPFDLQARVDDYVGLMNGGMAVVAIHDGQVATASAGIANDAGDPLTIDTPMLLWSPASALTQALALSLVEEGLLNLDALVTDYLPDAPVGEGATVRDLLESRAGVPSVNAAIDESITVDRDRTWTTDSMVALADPAEIGTVGEVTGSYTETLLVIQLIETLTGEDFATALDGRIVQPLGLSGTVHAEGDFTPPDGRAGGWSQWDGPEAIYMTDDWEAARTSRPTYSSAADLADFLQALIDGQLVSRDLLGETMWSDAIGDYGYGLSHSNDELFPAAGPLGGSYSGASGYTPMGSYGLIAFDPSSGDVVVAMTNNHSLVDETDDLAREVVQSWAPDASTSATMNEAQMELRFLLDQLQCDAGQDVPFDLPPCEATETEARLPFVLPYEMSGTFTGSGVETGLWLQNLEDGTFTYTARGVFMGEVEGCGYGTMYFSVDDGAGYIDAEGTHFTHGTGQILPGGSLSLAGTLDLYGFQDDRSDGTATMDASASYYCASADA